MSTITPKEFAQQVDSDARTVRKFLRSEAKANETETPGKGSRWEIESKRVTGLKKKFIAWTAAQAKPDETPEEG